MLFLTLLHEVRSIKLYNSVGIAFTLQVWKSCDELLYAKRTRSHFSDRQIKPLFTVHEACNNHGKNIIRGSIQKYAIYDICALHSFSPSTRVVFFPQGFYYLTRFLTRQQISASNTISFIGGHPRGSVVNIIIYVDVFVNTH